MDMGFVFLQKLILNYKIILVSGAWLTTFCTGYWSIIVNIHWHHPYKSLLHVLDQYISGCCIIFYIFQSQARWLHFLAGDAQLCICCALGKDTLIFTQIIINSDSHSWSFAQNRLIAFSKYFCSSSILKSSKNHCFSL